MIAAFTFDKNGKDVLALVQHANNRFEPIGSIVVMYIVAREDFKGQEVFDIDKLEGTLTSNDFRFPKEFFLKPPVIYNCFNYVLSPDRIRLYKGYSTNKELFISQLLSVSDLASFNSLLENATSDFDDFLEELIKDYCEEEF